MLAQSLIEELKEKFEIELPKVLPKIKGNRVLVLVLGGKKISSGGIILPMSDDELSRMKTMCGIVLELGPNAYSKDRFPYGASCQEGDLILFEQYAGSKHSVRNSSKTAVGFRFMPDFEIAATYPFSAIDDLHFGL